ncbi:hypothetical protein Bbelb_389190 [Branchiostoma belcheri]|nr:hypothetical protein Bbelb_389190 [Branchiostoma belcheri]
MATSSAECQEEAPRQNWSRRATMASTRQRAVCGFALLLVGILSLLASVRYRERTGEQVSRRLINSPGHPAEINVRRTVMFRSVGGIAAESMDPIDPAKTLIGLKNGVNVPSRLVPCVMNTPLAY